jgi:hypothetical protein
MGGSSDFCLYGLRTVKVERRSAALCSFVAAFAFAQACVLTPQSRVYLMLSSFCRVALLLLRSDSRNPSGDIPERWPSVRSREAVLPPGQIVGDHFPSTYVASESPGQGGIASAAE